MKAISKRIKKLSLVSVRSLSLHDIETVEMSPTHCLVFLKVLLVHCGHHQILSVVRIHLVNSNRFHHLFDIVMSLCQIHLAGDLVLRKFLDMCPYSSVLFPFCVVHLLRTENRWHCFALKTSPIIRTHGRVILSVRVTNLKFPVSDNALRG